MTAALERHGLPLDLERCGPYISPDAVRHVRDAADARGEDGTALVRRVFETMSAELAEIHARQMTVIDGTWVALRSEQAGITIGLVLVVAAMIAIALVFSATVAGRLPGWCAPAGMIAFFGAQLAASVLTAFSGRERRA